MGRSIIGRGIRALKCDPLPALAAVVAAILVHLGSLGHGFVYDDRTYLLENPQVTGDAPIFAAPTPPHLPQLGLYRPLTTLSFRATHALSGGDARAFHAGNVSLHALASALVAWLAAALGARRFAAFGAGLLFAVHPVHVEAVAWITGRAEVLATVLSLLALLTYGRAGAPRDLARATAAAALYALACLAKESAFALPLVFAWRDVGSGAPLRARAMRLAPAAAACAGVVLLRHAVLGRFGPGAIADPFLDDLTAGDRAPLALAVVAHAARLLAWPAGLSIHHGAEGFVTPLAVAAGAVLLAIAATCAIRWRARRPAAALGIALSLAGLVPFLHVVPIGALFAERFLYLASAGCVLVAADLFARRRAGRIGLLGIAAVLAALSVARVPVFRDDVALWQDAAAKDPAAGLPAYVLGDAYRAAGDPPDARHWWSESLRREHAHEFAAEAHVALARTEPTADRAEAHLRDALALAPGYAEAMLSLAALYQSGTVGRDEALALLDTVLRSDASTPEQKALARERLDRWR